MLGDAGTAFMDPLPWRDRRAVDGDAAALQLQEITWHCGAARAVIDWRWAEDGRGVGEGGGEGGFLSFDGISVVTTWI